MAKEDLSEKVKAAARDAGADLVGVVGVADLPEHAENIAAIVPEAKSVVVVAVRHSLAALRSGRNQIAQFDTIHAYDECARVVHRVSRLLESEGSRAAAVPAFIPLDMADPKKGMRGEICWRRTAVKAGLGSYGENGLLVTKRFGAAVRLAGVVTEADLPPDSPLSEDLCDHCGRCVEVCPAAALSGEGQVDKKSCGDTVFRYGLRFFIDLMRDLLRDGPDDADRRLRGEGMRELWQTFMTGNYYYCYRCQAECPATDLPQLPHEA